MNLDAKQIRFWNEKGYLVLERFFDPDKLDPIVSLHDWIWRERPSNVVVDDLETSERLTAAEIGPEKSQMRYKINDLYLVDESVRAVGLDARLVKILETLMVDRPVLINSLDVDYGTQQPFHLDSLFMTPPAPFNLGAVWVALEDASPDAGPLEYYPGSHIIPPYKFSDGTNHVVNSEMPQWDAYMAEQIAKFGLSTEKFIPKRGDVLIWHSYLLHRGSLALDKSLTRKSVIFHYFGESVSKFSGLELEPLNGGFWNKREPIRAVQIRETATEEAIVSEKAPDQDLAPDMGRTMKFLRTTLHHVRNWQRDISEI